MPEEEPRQKEPDAIRQAQFYSKLYDLSDDERANRMEVWRRKSAAPKVESVVRLTRGLKVSSVVELGAGFGHVLQGLSELGLAESYTAVDISDTALTSLRSKSIAGLRGAVLGTLERLPFPDRQFDLAVLSHVLEHLLDPVPCVMEAARVADHVVIEVPLEGTVLRTIRRYVHRLRHPDEAPYVEPMTGHCQFFSTWAVKALLKMSGMRIVRERLYILGEEVLRYNPSRTEEAAKWDRRRLLPVRLLGEALVARCVSPWRSDLAPITHFACLCTPAAPTRA